MKVTRIKLDNFRNYEGASIEFSSGKNIIIGENAQGKSNLLEAVELCASGRSSRAEQDLDFIRWGSGSCRLDLAFTSNNDEESIGIEIAQKKTANTSFLTGAGKAQKTIKVNGVNQASIRGLLGRIPVVSFKAGDLNLLRGGPKFRREWLDGIGVKLKPSYYETLSNYSKTIAQRNRLLKTLSEKVRLTMQDQDELLVWDKQLARFGTAMIKMRLKVLSDLLPLAQELQSHLSRADELLCIDYVMRTKEASGQEYKDNEADGSSEEGSVARSLADLNSLPEIELARILVRLLKQLRGEELRRRQSLVGPHRDDLHFRLNGANAIAFASQGQQRSIVLALKMAELKHFSSATSQTPILLLDDVLAELDTFRQALLLSAIKDDMQTIITTTHLSGFDPKWLQGAKIMTVESGKVHLESSSNLANGQ